jgi:DNA-binding HxlR family transcriptional regulator
MTAHAGRGDPGGQGATVGDGTHEPGAARMKTYSQYCATARALDLVGDRWVLLIVRELLIQGPSRFTDLRAGLPGIATNLLAARLAEMAENGLLTRVDAPPPVATGLYQLTERGRQLRPVLEALTEWGLPTMSLEREGDVVHGSWLGMIAAARLRDAHPERGPLTIAIDTPEAPVHLVSRDDGAGGGDGGLEVRRGHPAKADARLAGEARLIGGYLSGLLSLPEARDKGLRAEGDEDALRRLTPSQPVPATPTGSSQ